MLTIKSCILHLFTKKSNNAYKLSDFGLHWVIVALVIACYICTYVRVSIYVCSSVVVPVHQQHNNLLAIRFQLCRFTDHF